MHGKGKNSRGQEKRALLMVCSRPAVGKRRRRRQWAPPTKNKDRWNSDLAPPRPRGERTDRAEGRKEVGTRLHVLSFLLACVLLDKRERGWIGGGQEDVSLTSWKLCKHKLKHKHKLPSSWDFGVVEKRQLFPPDWGIFDFFFLELAALALPMDGLTWPGLLPNLPTLCGTKINRFEPCWPCSTPIWHTALIGSLCVWGKTGKRTIKHSR